MSVSSALSQAQLALARSRTYTLFSGLYLRGLTEESLPFVLAIAELKALGPDPFEADEAAADHQHLFGYNVFPYQSIFLDPSGLLGGEAAAEVERSYRQAGYEAGTTAESADHLGHELGLLAALSRREAIAREKGRPERARDLAGLQGAFLDQHLMRWLPALVLAVRQQGQPFYAALADLTMGVVWAHRADLGDGEPVGMALAPAPRLMDDEATTLADIVDYLLIPVYSGIYFSRDDIGRLAQAAGSPRGFGERRQMLLNLLRSAATYGGLEVLLKELERLTARWAAAYGQMAAKTWQARAAGTGSILKEMMARIEQLDRTPD